MSTFDPSQGDVNLPKFLILGGCGFIGRNLVSHLLEKSSKIYIIDKTLPEIAWLNETHKAAFNNPKVSFQSANLINPSSAEKAFDNLDQDIDYVINLASETRKGQSEPVYKEGILKLCQNVVQNVERKCHKLKTFVEFSTGALYASDKKPHKETEKVDEWCQEISYKYQAEQEVMKLKNYIIIRPAIVYGPGDRNGLTPRLVVGAIYKHLNEMMKLPWNAELRINTVHVVDLAKITYALCVSGNCGKIYNVVDQGDTTQGKVTSIISDIFNINHDYYGTTFTTIAKMDVLDVLEDINDKHMTPWGSICAANGVSNTPLSPYIHGDALTKRHIALDGSRLNEIGFQGDFQYPEVTKEALLEVLEDFIKLNMFPKALLD